MYLKMKHHIKGIAIILIAAFLPCVSSAEDKVKIVPEKSRTLSSPNGRFVLGQISDWRSDQYLLDTQTGRLWQSTEMTNEKGQSQPVFRIVLIQGPDGKLGQLPN